jgi:flagellar hook-basal body complex protein FliE
MSDIKIDDIRRQLEDISLKSKLTTPREKPGESFSTFLKNAVDDVNQDQLQAEKADLSFKMMMQVRSKLMEAYRKIMRTSGKRRV